MATDRLKIPPPPPGFILEETKLPPPPDGFELQTKPLSSVEVDTLFKEEKQKKPIKIPDGQPSLRIAPELTIGGKFKKFVRNIFEDKTDTNVKSQMIYQISKDTGRSLQNVAKNYDQLIRDPKVTGISPDPTTIESLETAFTGAVAVGASQNLALTGLGVALFAAIDEVENAIVSKIRGGEYKIGNGRNIVEFLPEDATRTSKEVVEIIDLIGKGMIAGRVTPQAKTAFKKVSELVTKNIIQTYSLPKVVHMDATKVKSILREGKTDKFSQSEKDLLLDLGLKGSEYRTALQNGVTVQIPAERVTKLVDKPFWGKIKETLRVPKGKEVIVSEKLGEVVEAPRGLLTEGKPIETPTPKIKAKVKKPKLSKSDQQELLGLKENLNSTLSRLSDVTRTNTQRLQDQKSTERIINLIKDKEPTFDAPELPFDSGFKEIEPSSLRQANIEGVERNQHFGDTNAAKKRIEDVERVSRAEITQFMRNAFDVTIRGFATYRLPRVAGFFRPDKKTVRSQITDDVFVLAHEVAHFLDNKIWGIQPTQRPQFREWQSELGRLDYDQSKLRTSEGFAEFVRHFVSTGEAQKLAPKFYDYFTGEFARENPKIYENVLKLKDLMTRYNKQGSVERVKSQINFDGKPPKQPLVEKFKDYKLLLKTHFLDDIAFLEDIYKREGIADIRPDQDPLQLLRAFKGKARNKAEISIRYNTIDYTGRVTGKGLVDVLKPVSKNKKELADFMAYAYSRRALSRPDIDAGIELTDAQYVFEKFDSNKFRKASDELSSFADRILDYYVDSRAISPEARNKIKELNPIYLPLYRFFSDEPRFRSKGSKISGGKPIKRLKGSGRQILNPIESMIKYVENLYSSADKVRVSLALRDLSEQNILPGGLIEKVPPPVEATTFKTKELDKKLQKTGYGIFKIFEEEPGALPDVMTMFMSSKNYSGKDNIIPIYEGDQVSFYELDPRLYSMVKNLDSYQLPPVFDFLFGKPTRMLKLGAVGLNAGFSYITNPVRDLTTYAMFTKEKLPNPAAPMVALAADLGLGTKAMKESARRFKAMGGEYTTMMGTDRSTYKRMSVDIENQAVGGITGNVKNVTLHPINTLRRIFEVPELAPRIAEFNARIKKYEKIYGQDSDAAAIAAFNDAQDITINFTKMGETAKMLNQLTAFFNPTIQGGEKLYREAKNNPTKIIVRGIAFITTPALYYWYQNKDKEWFKNLPAEQKYSNLYIDTGEFGGSGDIVSLPLPHEMGVLFGGLPMAYWDEMYEINPDGVEDALKLSLKQLNPGLTPSTVKPFLEIASNKNWYGAPIETRAMQRKEIPDRYNDYTMPIAKSLSRAIYDNFGVYEHASPRKIETFMNSATGGLAKNINNVVNYATKEVESKADLPVVGNLFLRKELYEDIVKVDFDRLALLKQKKVSKTLTSEQALELKKLERKYEEYKRNKKRKELQREMEQTKK